VEIGISRLKVWELVMGGGEKRYQVTDLVGEEMHFEN
jgi:hypothetical protein